MSILFFPGTLVHELSHMFMAIILQVKIGNMELIPKLIGQELKMGSVQIARSDPIRRVMIGMAPFLFGTSILLGIFFYAVQNKLLDNQIFIILIGYIVFEIGNTMFSSKRDMEGAFELLLVIIVLIILLYIVGFRLPILNPSIIFSNHVLKEGFQKGNIYLAVPLGIDLIVISLLKLTRI